MAVTRAGTYGWGSQYVPIPQQQAAQAAMPQGGFSIYNQGGGQASGGSPMPGRPVANTQTLMGWLRPPSAGGPTDNYMQSNDSVPWYLSAAGSKLKNEQDDLAYNQARLANRQARAALTPSRAPSNTPASVPGAAGTPGTGATGTPGAGGAGGAGGAVSVGSPYDLFTDQMTRWATNQARADATVDPFVLRNQMAGGNAGVTSASPIVGARMQPYMASSLLERALTGPTTQFGDAAANAQFGLRQYADRARHNILAAQQASELADTQNDYSIAQQNALVRALLGLA